MPRKSTIEQEMAPAAKIHELKSPIVVDHVEAEDPGSRASVHRFTVVDAGQRNGPSYPVIVDEHGALVTQTPVLAQWFDRTVLNTPASGLSGPGSAKISPETNVLTLNPGDMLEEAITVTIVGPSNLLAIAALAPTRHWPQATAFVRRVLAVILRVETDASSKRKLALIGLLLLACYVVLLDLAGFATSVPPMLVIALSAGISSIAGFAFSAVSQALLAPLMNDPVRIVEILMVCSIATQSFTILSLWRHMNWRGLPVYLGGGAVGLPIGVYLLLHLGSHGFRIAIGLLLIVYGTYVLVKRPVTLRRVGWPADVAVGFLGGITGGLAAFPGAAITVWCSMRGWDKTRQRGVYQPYILAMQLVALAMIEIMQAANGEADQGSHVFPYDALLFIPGTLLGTWFGLRIFHKISDRTFNRCLAGLLAFAGVVMIVVSHSGK